MEDVIVSSESRIVFAVIAVFVALAGIAASIRGLLFDESQLLRYGAAALIGGVACFVLLLNPSHEVDKQP
nr:DUF2964 family protein [Paraburkholderia fungorum]